MAQRLSPEEAGTEEMQTESSEMNRTKIQVRFIRIPLLLNANRAL